MILKHKYSRFYLRLQNLIAFLCDLWSIATSVKVFFVKCENFLVNWWHLCQYLQPAKFFLLKIAVILFYAVIFPKRRWSFIVDSKRRKSFLRNFFFRISWISWKTCKNHEKKLSVSFWKEALVDSCTKELQFEYEPVAIRQNNWCQNHKIIVWLIKNNAMHLGIGNSHFLESILSFWQKLSLLQGTHALAVY